jgi:hypothetical protein
MQDYSPAGGAAYNKLKQLEDWHVETYRSVDGGGTGLEYPDNLKSNYDSYGNKWYDCCSGETWIKGTFDQPIWIKSITLQSANDCDGRDPYTVSFWDEDDDKYLCKYDDIDFNQRYQKINFLVDSERPVRKIKILIERNKSLAKYGNWGDGTQLAQVIFYHI